VLLIEFAGRVNETHGGLAAIDDRDALELGVHRSLDRRIPMTSRLQRRVSAQRLT
jgi:hypothetical protein